MPSFLLKLLDLFKGIFTWMKVDYDQLRAIVAVKLTMDNRRQLVSHQTKSKREPSNSFLITLLIYALFGGFVSLAMYNIPSFIMSMILFFSYLIVMTVMTLITDFSSILLDTSDNTIILPRPVDGRTLFMARTIHILLYLGQMVLGLTLFPIIVVGAKFGVTLLPFFFITILLALLTAIVLTNAFYLLLMQFASEEKLKNIINYFQIVMAIFIMGGYQILPRIMERLDLENFVFEFSWWSYILPPVWFGGALEMIHFQSTDTNHLIVTACACVLPLGGAYFVTKYLTPVFSRKLGVLNNADAVTPVASSKTEKKTLTEKISHYITTAGLEQGTFNFIYKILGRDRKIKLKIYPSYGYVLIFGIIFMFKGHQDIATTWAELSDSHYYMVLLYLTFMITQVALFEVRYSDEFKASWIYFATPIEKPGEILSGTLKAIFIRLFLPAYLIFSIFILAVWGVAVVDDILFALVNNFAMLIILALINQRSLPLSIEPSLRGQSGNLARNLISFIIIGILGLAHYLLAKFSPWLVIVAIPVMGVITYMLMRAYKKTTWSDLVF